MPQIQKPSRKFAKSSRNVGISADAFAKARKEAKELGQFTELPNGQYHVRVEKAYTKRSKKDALYLAFSLRVLEGDYAGDTVTKFDNGIEDPDRLKWALGDIHRLGYDVDEIASMDDLEATLKEIGGDKPVVRLDVSRSAGESQEFINYRFGKVLSEEEIEELDLAADVDDDTDDADAGDDDEDFDADDAEDADEDEADEEPAPKPAKKGKAKAAPVEDDTEEADDDADADAEDDDGDEDADEEADEEDAEEDEDDGWDIEDDEPAPKPKTKAKAGKKPAPAPVKGGGKKRK